MRRRLPASSSTVALVIHYFMVVKVWAVEKDDPAFGRWFVGLKWSRFTFSDSVAGENSVYQE